MRIALSIFALLVVVLAFVALPEKFRKTIQRRIDNAISQSVLKQLSSLAIASGVIFCFLMLFMLIIHGTLKLNIQDWLLAFINHGSSFSIDGALDRSEKTWALIIGAVGIVFMSGTLISVIGNIIERRVDKVKNGRAYYYFNNHIIVIGYDRMCIGLLRQFAKDARYRDSEIVLLTTQEAPKVRHELFSRLESAIEKKLTIISGNRTSVEDLKRLHIDKCKEVFILGEKDEYDNDSLDVECIRKIHAILSAKPCCRIIRCNVLFEHQTTFTVFQRQDIEQLKDRIDFVPFNYYEMWAQKVFVERAYESLEKGYTTGKIEYPPLDRGGIRSDSDCKVHLVVIGMSEMGIAMGIQAAHLCHFPNFVTKGIKTRITFIDEHVDVEMDLMRGRYRHLFNETDIYYREVNRHDTVNDDSAFSINTRKANEIFTDVEFEFIRAKVEYPAIQDYLASLSCDEKRYLTVAVCFPFPPYALTTGLYLPDELYDNHIPVFVWQETPYCTLDMLATDGKYKHVKPFGMLENCYDLNKADDPLPMMVNYVYGKGIPPEKFPEDEIVAMWRDLRTALKWSNRYHADTIHFKIRSFSDFPWDGALDDEQIELMAKVEHNRWNMEKLLMGYRATTPHEKEEIAKDVSKKNEYKITRFAHNDICAYKDLQVDANGVCASEYDLRISAALPLFIRNNSKLQQYVKGIITPKTSV